MQQTKIALFAGIVLLLSLLSCGPDFIYREAADFPESGWTYDNPGVFTFTIPDTNGLYNLHLGVVHLDAFDRQNFYVRINTTFPNGESLSETVSLQLADNFGSWYGNCNRESCTVDILLQEKAFFNQVGDYRIEIEQFTRNNPVVGIQRLVFGVESIGLREE